MERVAATPRHLARIAGGLYLVNIVGGFFAIGYVPAVIFASGDPAATAHNIQSHELLYRLGIAAHVVILASNVPLAAIFYELFKVVNRRLSLLVVFFTLVATAVEGAGVLNQFAPLTLLGGGLHSGGLSSQQLQALAYVNLDMQGAGYAVSTALFSFYGLTIGYLVLRSTFLPRAIGALMAIGAASYLTYSFSSILSLGFAAHLVPYIQLPSLFGEGSLCLWLLLAGLNAQRWNEMATTAPSTSGVEPMIQ